MGEYLSIFCIGKGIVIMIQNLEAMKENKFYYIKLKKNWQNIVKNTKDNWNTVRKYL